MVPEQLADCLGVHVDVIYYEIRKKGAPHARVGRRCYAIFRDEWLAWMRGEKNSSDGERSPDLDRFDPACTGLDGSDPV
ncbi:MAG: helix-turn-helix domain-containing protein [Candidatus Tyrphobacter sp.]